MTGNKTDQIRNRKLSQHELNRMAALAGEESAAIPEDPAPHEKQKVIDAALPSKSAPAAPNKIESLAGEYYDSFEKKYGDNAACALTVASMNLEAAVMIVKALKEIKWSEVKK